MMVTGPVDDGDFADQAADEVLGPGKRGASLARFDASCIAATHRWHLGAGAWMDLVEGLCRIQYQQLAQRCALGVLVEPT